MRSLPAVVAIVAACSLAAAEPTERKAWEWTLEERLAMRLEANARKERVMANAREWHQDPVAALDRTADSLSGRTTPELYLPHEVFERLLAYIERFEAGKEPMHAGDETLRAAGFDPLTFWSELSLITAPLREIRRRTDELRNDRHATFALEMLKADACRAEFDALQAARDRFGAVAFDRFLYTSIAPFFAVTTGGRFDEYARRLRERARGCR
jgi:hypothetical protein